MLSQDLSSLQDFVIGCRASDGSVRISERGADALVRAIGACISQARAMEETPIVLPIDAVRIREETCRQMIETARLAAGALNVVMLHANRPLWASDGPRDGGGAA